MNPAHSPTVPCFHGGAFFEAIGPRFDALERRHDVINADVLDAWFPPAPGVLRSLNGHLEWLARTSPPTHAEGLVSVLSEVREVPRPSLLPGAGSSDLIFLALGRWLKRGSRVLLLDPTYGEYRHLCESVVGCRMETVGLREEDAFRPDPDALARALATGPDVFILVNPNSPTGQVMDPVDLRRLLRLAPASTLVWVDETYREYVDGMPSLERLAGETSNLVVCKSMSKVYALSGLRAAYLCGAPDRLAEIRGWVPPWAVSLPAQVAAVAALQDPEYYQMRYHETDVLRGNLADGLTRLGWSVVPGCANFLLARLPESAPDAAVLERRCRRQGLYLRRPAPLRECPGDRYLRLAVKDASTQDRMVGLLRGALQPMAPATQ